MVPDKYTLITENFRKDVGKLIRKTRREKDIRQEQLAIGVGLTRTSINNIEHGRQRVLLDTLLMISYILGVPITDLIPHTKNITVNDWIEMIKNNKNG